MAIDVARWYTPDVRRTPEAIETAYGDLAVRLVRAARPESGPSADEPPLEPRGRVGPLLP